MAAEKSECRKQAFEIYKESKGAIKLKDLAKQLGVTDLKIRKWKSIDKWDEKLKGTFQNDKGNVPDKQVERSTKEKRGAPPGNQNAKGNKGGHGAPVGNDHAVKHGFFARIFPDDEETRAIIEEIQIKSPLDMLWENIVIQYTAIARAQKLMFVKDQEDITEHLKKRKVMSDVKNAGSRDEKDYQAVENFREEEWELQFAWDKHANFLKAQSRAIHTLERLITRYEEMLLKDLNTEEQQLRIEKLRTELEKIKNPGDVDIHTYLEALNQTAEDVWAADETENGADEQ
jgi:uncharacterized protein YjcR